MPSQSKLKHFISMKEKLSPEGKGKLLKALRLYKEIQEPMWISEDGLDKPERNVVAKTFDTKADFDSYVNQRRGIEMTPKEQQSILNFTKVRPTQRDRFFVKYETTDAFGNNTTTVIKKLKEGSQFVWTAFSKYETAEEEGKPEGAEEEPKGDMDLGKDKGGKEDKGDTGDVGDLEKELGLKEAELPPEGGEDEVTVDDPIRITKSITFTDDVEGANVLADLLQKLEI